jgi:hypothetical protein
VFAENEKHAETAINYLKSAETKGTRRSAMYRTGFVSRPFKDDFDYIGGRVEEVCRTVQVQATAYRPGAGKPYAVQEMLEQINFAHFGVADITSLNQNVLIEAGVMIGIDKPLILLKNKNDNAPLPFNIAGRQVYQYEQKAEDIVIYAATDSFPLERFISEFVEKLKRENREFNLAKPWYG